MSITPDEKIALLEKCIEPRTANEFLTGRAFEKCRACPYNGQRGCVNMLINEVIQIAKGRVNNAKIY